MYTLYVGFGLIMFAFVFSYWILKLFSFVYLLMSKLNGLHSRSFFPWYTLHCVCEVVFVSLFFRICALALLYFFVYLPVSKLSRPHLRSHFPPRALICIFAATLTLSYIYNTSHFFQQHNTEHSVYESTLTLSYIYNTSHFLQQHNTAYSVYELTLTLSYIYNTSHFLQQHNTEHSMYKLTLTISYIYKSTTTNTTRTLVLWYLYISYSITFHFMKYMLFLISYNTTTLAWS